MPHEEACLWFDDFDPGVTVPAWDPEEVPAALCGMGFNRMRTSEEIAKNSAAAEEACRLELNRLVRNEGMEPDEAKVALAERLWRENRGVDDALMRVAGVGQSSEQRKNAERMAVRGWRDGTSSMDRRTFQPRHPTFRAPKPYPCPGHFVLSVSGDETAYEQPAVEHEWCREGYVEFDPASNRVTLIRIRRRRRAAKPQGVNR